MGWRLFLDGFVCVEWAKLQHSYFNWIGGMKSGRECMEGVAIHIV